MKRTIISLFVAILATGFACANQTIVKDGKAVARIVIPADADSINSKAATLLQDFVGRISGAQLPIIKGAPRNGDVAIGYGNTNALTEDGFRLESHRGILYISSGGDNGALYGVVTLLENYLGVAYYAAGALDVPKMSTEATEKVGVFGICWSKCDIFLKKRGHIRRFLQSFGFEIFVKAC